MYFKKENTNFITVLAPIDLRNNGVSIERFNQRLNKQRELYIIMCSSIS